MESKTKKELTFKVTIITNIVTIIVGGITIISKINSHIEYITKEQTKVISVFFAKDIRTRLNLFETYVEEEEKLGRTVPTLIRYNIRELENQLEEIKKWESEAKR